MKIVVTGGSGFLGRQLCAELVRNGHVVTALSRDAGRARLVLGPSITCISWDYMSAPGAPWEQTVAAADTVIHLAGAPVGEKAWTSAVKEELKRSRVETTRKLVDVIRASVRRPDTFVCASGINYYGDAGEASLTENSPPGRTFLAELSVAWENEAIKAEALGVRVVRHRTGIVLGNGGPLEKLLYPLPVRISPWKLGLGGPIGSGRQWFPWIHLADAVAMFAWSATDPRVTGPVNTVAPGLIRNIEFSRALGSALRRPAIVPIPGFLLQALAGDFAEELQTGQRAVPQVALELGFQFQYPEIEEALCSILRTIKK